MVKTIAVDEDVHRELTSLEKHGKEKKQEIIRRLIEFYKRNEAKKTEG